METLPLRMERHCSNAQKVAEFLLKHDKVINVIFPSVMKGEGRSRADKYLNGGYGSLIGFEVASGADGGKSSSNL